MYKFVNEIHLLLTLSHGERNQSNIQNKRVPNQSSPSSVTCLWLPLWTRRGMTQSNRDENKNNSGETRETLYIQSESVWFDSWLPLKAVSWFPLKSRWTWLPKREKGPCARTSIYRTLLPSLGENRMWWSVLFVFITPKYFFKEVLFFNRSIRSFLLCAKLKLPLLSVTLWCDNFITTHFSSVLRAAALVAYAGF